MQAVLHADADQLFAPAAQPVTVLDYIVKDVAAVRSACLAAAWPEAAESAFEHNGILIRLHTNAAGIGSPTLPWPVGTEIGKTTQIVDDLELEVAPNVYEPGAGAALMVSRATVLLADSSTPIIVDVGCGTGAIALALARRFPAARVFGTDISVAAIECSRRNAERHGLGNAEFIRASLFDGLPDDVRSRVDLIAANLPWVPRVEVEVARLEQAAWRGPLAAVVGDGADGLDLLRAMLRDAPLWLRPGGTALMTAHQWQLRKLRQEFTDYEFTHYEEEQLLAGVLRASAAPRSP